MSDREFQLEIRQVADDCGNPMEPKTRVRVTGSEIMVASVLRAVANELDPPRPVTREHGLTLGEAQMWG